MLAALLPTLIGALVPVAADGVRGIFNYFTGGAGAQPANVQEAIQLMAAETSQLEAIAKLDAASGNISQWVADLRASFRYIGAGVIIAIAPVVALWTFEDPSEERRYLFEFYMTQVLGPIWGFLYGQRLQMQFRKK